MSNRRKDNWPELLHNFIHQRRDVGFDWKFQNCCFFACDWIKLCTGIDPARGLRVKGGTKLGAAKLMKSMKGVEGIARTYCAKHNFPEIHVNFAQRGDIVIVDLNSFNNPSPEQTEHHSVGIVLGTESAFVGPKGLSFVPTNVCRLAWRIS